jgi:hypothetical protein
MAITERGGDSSELSLERFIARYSGVGRYARLLVDYLHQEISAGFQGELRVLIDTFDKSYVRRKEVGKMEKKEKVEVLRGAIIRTYPELLGDDAALLRLAQDQGFLGEENEPGPVSA